MPKGYWIAHVAATQDDAFTSDAYKAYVEGAAPAFKEHGGTFLARGGSFEQMEGNDLGPRHVVIEFASLDAAKACYNSDVYQSAIKHRTSVSAAHIILMEGYEG